MSTLILKIKNFLQQLSCVHADVDLIRWHWTHGPNGNDIRSIEAEYRCKKCGKAFYTNLHGKDAHEWAAAMGNYREYEP